MLAAAPAKQNTYAEFFHQELLYRRKALRQKILPVIKTDSTDSRRPIKTQTIYRFEPKVSLTRLDILKYGHHIKTKRIKRNPATIAVESNSPPDETMNTTDAIVKPPKTSRTMK